MDNTSIQFNQFLKFLCDVFIVILFFSGSTFLVKKLFMKNYNAFSLDKMLNMMKAIFYGGLAILTIFLNFTTKTFYVPETVTITQILVFLLSSFEMLDNIITLFSRTKGDFDRSNKGRASVLDMQKGVIINAKSNN